MIVLIPGLRSSEGLPPDPDNLNAARSAEAGESLKVFQLLTGAEDRNAVADLLADLMHYCDRHEQEFSIQLSRAARNYIAETTKDK